jgi:hypothetical protein
MAVNYATKSIVVIDFIDVNDIAIASPFLRASKYVISPSQSVTYRHVQKINREEDVHLFAVFDGNSTDCQLRKVEI